MNASWIAFALYAAVALGLGWRARRGGGGDAYWTAGRGLGATSVGLSISAGFMSVSWSCVYATQLFYTWGIGAVWLVTVPWLLALAGIHALARRYHALAAFSQPEMVAARFGAGTRVPVALALAFVFLVWGGAEIWVAAGLLAPQMGVSITTLVILIGAVVGAYSALGGFGAVVATDRLQFALVAGYVLAVAALAVRGLADAGGWPDAALAAPLAGRPWSSLLAPGVATIVLTFVAYLPGWLFETDLWLRVQAARSDVAARRGVALAAVNAVLFVGVLPGFIAIAALAAFPPDAAGGLPADVGAEGEAIFAAFTARHAPDWLQAVVALGLVAAAMSTIDTCTNVVALSVGRDLLRADASSRAVTLAAVAGACIFALYTDSLWDIFYLSSGILTTTVALPVAAVLVPWARAWGVAVSSVAGALVTLAAYFLESRGHLAGVQPRWLSSSGLGYILWGLVAAGVGYAAGHLAAGRDAG